MPRAAALKVVKPVQSIGNLIDALAANRDRKRELEAQIKLLEESWREAQTELIALLDAQGIEGGKGLTMRADIKPKVNYSVSPENWPELVKYAIKNNRTDLLYRRVSNPGIQELLELGKKVPGIEKYEERVISLRKL